jgi:hypothetical protein
MVSEDAERLAARLRLSNGERQELLALSDMRGFTAKLAGKGVRAMLYRESVRSVINGLLLLRAGRTGETGPSWAENYTLASDWKQPIFPLTGHDLMAFGLKPGPELGQMLKTLEDVWIERGFMPTREELLAMIRKD